MIILSNQGKAELFPGLFAHTDLDQLESSITWTCPQIKVYGKSHAIPRLQGFQTDPGISYKYSGTKFFGAPWSKQVLEIKQQIESEFRYHFNSVLCNLYRNGSDYMSLHSDNEPELGINPIIASVSFGGTRVFHFQSKGHEKEKTSVELAHGDVLIMSGELQTYWNHGLKKTKREVGRRLNLTFRNILTNA